MLLTAAALAGCGGGGAGDTPPSSACSLSSTAGCGGSAQPSTPTQPSTPDPATKVASVNLVFSSNELPSAGTAGSEVAVTALVKTAQNTAVAGAKVEFSADSGLLGAASAVTDAGGKATALLGTGGSKLNRPIKVSVKSGTQSAEGVVNVTGTQLTFSGPAFVALGGSADLVATLVDSAGKPIAGAPLTASAAKGNAVQLGATASDARGQVPVHLTASVRGAEQLTLSALGATVSRSILVGGNDVALTPGVAVDPAGVERLTEVAVGTCAPVGGSYMIGGAGQSGSVTVSASRGMLYRNSGCSTQLSGAMAFSGGAFPALWIRSDNAGVATIEARVANGPVGSTRVEFVAGLGALSRVDLQSDIAVVGSGERSTLTAVVRDGTPANNLVKGATVQFSILADPSGGTLLSPFSAVTGSDGVARAVFVAGPADGGKDGTVVQARIAEMPAATDRASLTVNKKALSIQFGTGNKLIEVGSQILQQDFAVFVSDSAGSPVKDVVISASAWPTRYGKGEFRFETDASDKTDPGSWRQHISDLCANEDLLRKGIYERAYDVNNNGTLEPGIPLSVSVDGKTDATGVANVSLRYPRDRGAWLSVALTVSGSVAGTESVARSEFLLPVVGKDFTDRAIAPPGQESPYGKGACTDPG